MQPPCLKGPHLFKSRGAVVTDQAALLHESPSMDKRQRYCWPALLLTLTMTPTTDMSAIARLMLSCVRLAFVPLILVDACATLDAFQGVSIDNVYLRLLGARIIV